MFPFRLLPLKGEWSAWARWLPPLGDYSALGSLQLFSPLSSQSSCPQSLLRCLQPTVLPPLLEPWLSDSKWKSVHWPFKWLFASPALHLWQTATLPLFASCCDLYNFGLWVAQIFNKKRKVIVTGKKQWRSYIWVLGIPEKWTKKWNRTKLTSIIKTHFQ